jgi:hypothetical protein
MNLLFEHLRGLNKIDPICINPVDVLLNPAKYKGGAGLDQSNSRGLVYGGLLEQPVVTRRETGTQRLDIAVPRHSGGLDISMPRRDTRIDELDSLFSSPLTSPERGFGYPTHQQMGPSIGTVPNGQWQHSVRDDFSTGNAVRKTGLLWPCGCFLYRYTNTWGWGEEP